MKSKEKKPMSLGRKILSVALKVLVILVCLGVVAVAVFAVMFKDTFITIVKNPRLIPYVVENWGSLSKGLNTSTDDLDAEVKANAEAQAKAFSEADINLSETDIGNLSDEALTEEERAAIIYNAMTSSSSTEQTENGTDETGEDAVDASETNKSEDEETQSKSESDRTADNKEKDKGADASADKKNEAKAPDASSEKPVQSQQTKPADKAPPVQSPAVSTDNTTSAVLTSPAVQDNTAAGKMTEEQYNTRVSELVAKMYSIKADFITQLSAFESRIISEYKALPKEQRTSATKTRIVSENMSYVMGLEAQCDAQVKAVTDELTAIMTANGKPTTLVDQINAAYVSEKEIKKAYYVSLYK